MLGVAREWNLVRADGWSGSESLCSVSLTSMSTTRTRTSSSWASSNRYGRTLGLCELEGEPVAATADVVAIGGCCVGGCDAAGAEGGGGGVATAAGLDELGADRALTADFEA